MHLEGEYTHPYKFDVKARLAVTHQRGLIVDLGYRGNSEMAERVGFEPTVGLPLLLISSQADSTALAPLRTGVALKRRVV